MIAALAVAAIAASNFVASANPRPQVVSQYSSTEDALATIFLTNLPVNLVWFGFALLAAYRVFGTDRLGIPRRSSKFLGLTLAVVIVVTALGAVIDYTLLLGRNSAGYALYYDAVNWTTAASLIFASIYFSSMLLLDLDPKFGLIPAAAMSLLNPIWWNASMSSGMFSLGSMTLMICSLLSPIIVAYLWAWHWDKFGRKTHTQTEGSQ